MNQLFLPSITLPFQCVSNFLPLFATFLSTFKI
nr:MAG TPA: hypothetical protein [Caudoviricetes sp.]